MNLNLQLDPTLPPRDVDLAQTIDACESADTDVFDDVEHTVVRTEYSPTRNAKVCFSDDAYDVESSSGDWLADPTQNSP